jgi:hypothetical protein
MTAPAVEARARDQRSHHRIVQTLGMLAAEFTDLSSHYAREHIGSAEAVAQQSLLEDACALRLAAALVIRGTYDDTMGDLWIEAAAHRLARVYTALRDDRGGLDHGQA